MSEMTKTNDRVSIQGKRILYIEDDMRNRGIVQIILRQAGADIHFERAGNLHHVMMALRTYHPIDLILLDLMFPGDLTGYDVYNAIQDIDTYANIPVVVVSASDPAIEIPKSKELGLTGFISKPISMVDFPKQIEQALNGEPVWVADSH